MKTINLKLIICCMFLFLGGNQRVFSQTSSAYFYENEFDLAIPVKEKWSLEAGFGNRGLLAEVLEGETTGYQHQHLEINHFTNYISSEFLVFSLGLRYRFKELFDEYETDEFRIIEQIELESSNPSIPISHRFRLEQRFTEHTVHRLRYELGYGKPISEVFSWTAATEALYAVSSHIKPEAEQRFSLGIENSSFKDIDLKLIFQYRIEDYARNPANEFFLITGVSILLKD